MNCRDAVILCGGLGTRLGALTRETPKPLLPINGRPFLLHLLKRLQKEGVRRFFLAARYLSEQFADFVKVAQREFESVELIIEPEPLGTGGALRHAAEFVAGKYFWGINGDSFVAQSLAPVARFAEEQQSRFAMVAVKETHIFGGARDKGGLRFNDRRVLENFRGHASAGESWQNGGIYHVSRDAVLNWPAGQYDLEQKLQQLMGEEPVHVFCSEALLLDIGKPETLGQAAAFFKEAALPTWENV